MCRKAVIFFALLVLYSSVGTVANAQDAKGVVTDVARAMGITNLNSIQYSGRGYWFTFGQNYKPTEPWPKFTLKTYTRVLDFANGASEDKLAWVQFEPGERGGGFIPVKGEQSQDSFLSGDYAWNSGLNGGNGAFAPPLTGSAEERRLRLAITPHGWVKAAMAASPTVDSKKTKIDGKEVRVISFTFDGKYRVKGYVDDQNLLQRVETWIPQSMLGDMPVEVTYTDYRDVSGIKFPGKIMQKEGGFTTLDLTVTEVIPNAPVTIQVPEKARKAQPPVSAVTEPVTDGVWIVRAGGVQSMGVEFKDYTLVVDAAGDEERSLAVISEMKKLAPNKPIGYVVNTHHHLDHSGGLRTFVAEGATIITAEVNKPFYEKLFTLPFTIEPDRLAKNPQPAKFVAVKDKYVLTDGTRSLECYVLQNNTHDAGLLVAYLPKEKIMAVADSMVGGEPTLPPPDAPPPANITNIGLRENLQDNIRRLKLDVQQFVPMHGNGKTPFVGLQKQIEVEHAQLQTFESSNKGN